MVFAVGPQSFQVTKTTLGDKRMCARAVGEPKANPKSLRQSKPQEPQSKPVETNLRSAAILLNE